MPITVYVDMVADLFHLGHVEFLRKAKEHGDVLKVGIHNDETVEGSKRKPVDFATEVQPNKAVRR